MKLTKREIDKITLPTQGQTFYWDEELKGFGLRATPSGMSYVVRGTVRGGGRRPRITLGRHGPFTPDMARAEARKALGEMERGIDRVRAAKAQQLAGVTLDAAYRAYVDSKKLSVNTLRDYASAMRIAFGDWATLPISRISGGMVSRRFDERSEAAPVQANQMFRFLRALLGWAMWKYAHDDGTPLIATNPCDILSKLKRWNRVQRRTRHVEQGRLASFVHALIHQPSDCPQRRATKDLCALLVLTGLRDQEGCGLRWADVDLQRRLITVRGTKNGKDHTLPVGPWLADRLGQRLVEVGGSPFVFPAENKEGHLRHHRKHVLALVKGSGVEFRLHDLRRTFASIVNHHLERSLSAYTIKRLMNHSSGSDVTAGYIQHPVETLRQPMEMVETFVLRSAGLQSPASVSEMFRKAA
jgi:integrase